MKRVLLFVLCLLTAPAIASHIVGGEFEFIFRGIQPASGFYRYNLGLILYFDEINGNPGAKDLSVTIRIFRKRDNFPMRTVTLSLINETDVQYKKPQCSSNDFIRTDRFYYTYTVGGRQADYVLDPAQFSDPQGYYISWERCCRNYTITNIFSQDPNFGGVYGGQTFYMEFPPLRKNGEAFYNSSPTLFQPLSDFACPNRLYRVNFAGTDPDGDSLVYSMSVPFNTLSGDALPQAGVPGPAPYPPVRYRSPFSLTNIMSGSPDLAISPDGELTVVPTLSGLFVFAVKCEEFRNGEKIGEVRRDFQMLVLRNCPPASPPVIEAKRRTDASFVRNQLNVSWTNTATDQERCIDVRVSDPDAAVQEEEVEIIAVAVGFKNDNVKEVLPDLPVAKLSNGNSASFSVCFSACPYTPSNNYTLDIVVLNESCGGSLMDTLRVDVTVEPPVNVPPVFTPSVVEKTVLEGGQPFVVEFTAQDADQDLLTLIPPKPAVIDFPKYGFTVEKISEEPGRIVSRLTWNTECDKYDFSERRQFVFKYIVDDNDKCKITPNDTLVFNLKRQINDFHDPVIEYVPDPTLEKVTITRKIYEAVNFDVRAYDVDKDVLTLGGQGVTFPISQYGAVFPEKTFTERTTTPFSWYLDCSKIDLRQKDTFLYYLIVRDNQNICGYDLADTLQVEVKVLPPDNRKPLITANGDSDVAQISFTLGSELVIPLVGTDQDNQPKDNLKLEMIQDPGIATVQGFSFTGAEGQSPVTGSLVWTPDCSVFAGNDVSLPLVNEYMFRFRVVDNRCLNPKGDTVTVALQVKDVANENEFLPPNVITPRFTDGRNDYFAMEALDENQQLFNILPKDNCLGSFVNITIMNRWGRPVFSSASRDFKWFAEGQPAGVYFYVLKYTHKEYKGTISVMSGDGEASTNR